MTELYFGDFLEENGYEFLREIYEFFFDMYKQGEQKPDAD